MNDMCLQINILRRGITLLPFQGAFAVVNLPRALPWAMRCWAFSPLIECLYTDSIILQNSVR